MANDSRSDTVTAYFTAVRKGKLAEVRAFLRAGMAVDVRIPKVLIKPGHPARVTALMIAAEKGHRAIVKLLLAEGANPSAINEFKRSVLSYAVEGNQPGIVSLLLKAGADPNQRGYRKEFVLRAAAAPNADPRIAKLLIQYGADVNMAAEHRGTALHIAAYRGNLVVARLLLKAGADVNQANDFHGGPLTCALVHRQATMVAFLLKHGADPKAQPEALGLAAWEGMLQTVKRLLAAGFDPNSHAWQGRTPLQHARNRKHRKVVEVLLAAGATG